MRVMSLFEIIDCEQTVDKEWKDGRRSGHEYIWLGKVKDLYGIVYDFRLTDFFDTDNGGTGAISMGSGIGDGSQAIEQTDVGEDNEVGGFSIPIADLAAIMPYEEGAISMWIHIDIGTMPWNFLYYIVNDDPYEFRQRKNPQTHPKFR